MKDEDGRRRRFTREDLDAILERAARQPDGTYRVLASRNIARPSARAVPLLRHAAGRSERHLSARRPARAAGPASVRGLAESRRGPQLELARQRGRAGRTRQIVRHHLLDFGSTLGSDSVKAQSRRAGNEFVWESRPTLITMLTLGLYVRPWIKVDYPEMPAVGRLRVHVLPRRELEARLPEPGVPERAAGRSLLGGPDRCRIAGRGGGGGGAVPRNTPTPRRPST